MKQKLLIVLIIFLSSCSRYYHLTDARKYLPQPQDTLKFYKYLRMDTVKMAFIDEITAKDDTIFITSYTPDSLFFDISTYIIDTQAFKLYSEFYAYGHNILFFNIKNDLVFSFGKKSGKMNVKKILDAPTFYQKVVYRSVGSEPDEILWRGDTIQVFRVDIKSKQKFINKAQKDKSKSSKLLHFYYYPGVGIIKITGDDYYEKILNFKPEKQ